MSPQMKSRAAMPSHQVRALGLSFLSSRNPPCRSQQTQTRKDHTHASRRKGKSAGGGNPAPQSQAHKPETAERQIITLSREDKIVFAQIGGSVGDALDLIDDIESSAKDNNLRALARNVPKLGRVLSRLGQLQRPIAALNTRVQREVRR